jgi:chromosome segregation ATPase
MVLLFTPTGFLEITFFLLAIVVFVMAVRFFMDSRKRLEALFPGLMGSGKLLPFGIDRSGFLIPKTIDKTTPGSSRPSYQPAAPRSADNTTREEIKALRTQVQQQQQELSKALQQIALVSQRSGSLEEGTALLLNEQKRQEGLRMQLNSKDAEIQRLRQQELLSQKMQERFEEVQTEFEKLQEKMQKMEKQAWQAAELSIQLEHAEQAQFQLEKSLQKKEEKLRELMLENQNLQESFHELEEKLSHANLQRQQLIRKVQFLEEANADMLNMAETNRKLKTEMGRVAELESMLELMREEKSSLRRF